MKNLQMIIAKLMIAFYATFLPLCSAGIIDPEVDDTKYLEYGNTFDHILKLNGEYTDDSNFTCSCVAIDDRWIITAAHALINNKNCYVQKDDGTKILVEQIIIHPSFEYKNFNGNDIAICYLVKSLNLKNYPKLYEKDDELNKLSSICGYGSTGNFISGKTKHDGKKRAGFNCVERIDKNLLICSPSKENKTKLEIFISDGDSGGGLFIENKLAGINSCISSVKNKKTNSSYGDESGHSRISLVKNWIENHIDSKKKVNFEIKRIY